MPGVTFVRRYWNWKYLVQFTTVFAAYFIAGKLGQATTDVRSNNLGPVWPAYGVALAAILLCGYRIWPAVALGSFVIAYLSPESYLTALGQTLGSLSAALIGAFLLRRVAKFDNSLSRLRDALALVLIGALGSAMVSASVGTLVLRSSHINSYAGLGSAWLIYWLGDSSGVLLVTPLLLTFAKLLRIRNWGRLAELICLLTILVAICAVVFGDLAIVPVRMMAFAVLPLVIWAAIRFGVSGAALSIFLVATVATVKTALGTGSFASSNPYINGVQLDVFFAVLSLTGLMFASVYAERELAEREREQSLREQVGMEIRLQNQELLRASEERLRLAQQVSRIGTFDVNFRTGVTTWTPELEAIYGLPPGGFEGTQTAFQKLVHPHDREEVMALLGQSFETRKPTYGEWRILLPEGGDHWIAGCWQAFMSESGEPSRIIGVNRDITDQKLAEQRLREYEKAVEGVEEFIIVLDREFRCQMANREFLKRRDLTSEQVVGHFAHEFLDKEIYENAIKPKLEECFRGNVVRYELKYPYPRIGERDLFASCYPVEGNHGVDRAACILHDITDRKRAEQALADMSRKLLESQEQERVRIGRELHDDINQRLAMLAIELKQLPEDTPKLQIRVQELREELSQISEDVQALSHDLHSSKLQYFGAVRGIGSWCKEFAQRQKMEVAFRSDVHTPLPLSIGIPLFRVLQEALHNASKHSGVKRVEVQLREDCGEIHLVVSDSGAGFDVEAAFHSKGLGLSSMRERVRLINGTIAIESKPAAGTTIHVRVPMDTEPETQRKAG